MSNSCSYPCSCVIDVLADECDGTVTNILVEGLSIGVVIDECTEVLMNLLAAAIVDDVDMFGAGMIILFVEVMIASGVVRLELKES